jgi:membrane associated rhomboid family serine protease
MKILTALEDFIRAHFDKLALIAIFLFLVWVVIRFDASTTGTWAQQQAGTVIGALIMLITGMGARKGDKPGE